jgi:hypothetical protein
MANIIKALPDPVNLVLLFEELKAQFPQLTMRADVGEVEIHNVTDDTPTNTTIDGILAAHNPNTLTSGQVVQTAKQSILALANKADNHAARIALCFASILESENLGEDADATFLRITTALNDAIIGNGYRTAVMTAFTAKHGLSFSFADVGIVILTTRQSFNRFSAEFFTRWAFMVNLR